jgi:hypothetical protein
MMKGRQKKYDKIVSFHRSGVIFTVGDTLLPDFLGQQDYVSVYSGFDGGGG